MTDWQTSGVRLQLRSVSERTPGKKNVWKNMYKKKYMDVWVMQKKEGEKGGFKPREWEDKKTNLYPIRGMWGPHGGSVSCEKLKETDSNCPISTSNKPRAPCSWRGCLISNTQPQKKVPPPPHTSPSSSSPCLFISTTSPSLQPPRFLYFFSLGFFCALVLSISSITLLSNSPKHCTGYTSHHLSPV